MKWAVILSPGAVTSYKRLQEATKKRVRDVLERLADDPWGLPYRKLKGKPFYRVRVGEWRIVYSVDEIKREVYVVAIDKRSRVYKRL